MKITNTHVYFWDGIYSNWHPAQFTMPLTKKTFANSEQAFMWYKAFQFEDVDSMQAIEKQTNPKEVKKLGRLVKGFDEMEWNDIRYTIMVNVCYHKFDQNKPFQDELMRTGSKVLVEASPYDKVWGVGLLETDPLILDEKNWQGLNLLGKALMDVRNQFEFERGS